MILLMSGFPYAGKTEFIKILLDKVDHNKSIHINPKNFYVENFEDLDDDEKSAVGITAWEMSIERAHKCLDLLSNEALIILDTCCAKFNTIQSLISDAKNSGHKMYCVFVNSSIENRKIRASGKNIESFEQRYAEDFLHTLPKLKEESDKFMIVHNNDIECLELNKCARLLSEIVVEVQSK